MRKLRILIAGLLLLSIFVTVQQSANAQASASTTVTLYRVGSIGCDGNSHNEPAGSVTVTRAESQITVGINVNDNLYPSQPFTVEAWEEAPGCYPDNDLVVPGVGLTTDAGGSGSTSFTLPLPYVQHFPNGSTVTMGDGIGTERLIVVLDRSGSTGAGDSYASDPIPLPAIDQHDVTADFASQSESTGRATRFDASASSVPAGSTATYYWDFGDGTPVVSASTPVITHTYSYTNTGARNVSLTVASSLGIRNTTTKQVKVPVDTVLVLLNGIAPLGVASKKGAYEQVGGDTYRDLLAFLGCGNVPADSVTEQCNDGAGARLFWSPFSYLGPNGQAAPLPYGGADTHKPLATTAQYLDDQVRQIRAKHPDANLIFVGYSEGGTVAARWAAARDSYSTPVITLDSMLYGFWPENRSTSTAEDIADYCGTSRGDNRVATPGPTNVLFYTVCNSWTLGGFRSDVSYDWRAERVFGTAGDFSRVGPLQLFNATNRNDVVAPPWWNVSPLADGHKVVSCLETDQLKHGHGCILQFPAAQAVFSGITGVVAKSLGSAKELKAPSAAESVEGWGDSDHIQQFSGFTTGISVPNKASIVAVAEWGQGEGAAVSQLTCVVKPAVPVQTVDLQSTNWRSHSYVVFWRPSTLPVVMASRVRVLPFADTTRFQAQVSAPDLGLLFTSNPCG
ncbi:PKD domain-containing protein [Frankia sp. Cr2]|uniref:PKD domain-containing protein n=1 Tax=Frankia sp. Cr2 TaxID=3073932 RepID=UPI002AD57627|nr:PKD domain-containing protein [Frankia sp. Cr2]